MRAQKDTQEAFMRYTSYREIEQQARLAVTNAEKRRDDISEQWRPYSRCHLLISYSGYYSSPKSDTHGFVNTLFASRDNRTIFSLQMLNQESHQYQETIDAVLQGILWRYVALNYFSNEKLEVTFIILLGGQKPRRSLHECPCRTKTNRVASRWPEHVQQ